MAHFALLDNADNVINVIVVADEDCLDADGNESELVGIDFCVRVAPHLNTTRSNWKQTSYTSFAGKRYNPDTGEEIEGDAYYRSEDIAVAALEAEGRRRVLLLGR